MEQKQDERSIVLAVTELQQLSEEFADEIGRRPSCEELFDILTWGLRSEYFDTLLSIHSKHLVLKPLVKRENTRIDSAMNADEIESRVADLNDNVFEIAAEFVWGDLIKTIPADTGGPTLEKLCHLLVEALHQCDEKLLLDISPRNILTIQIERESS